MDFAILDIFDPEKVIGFVRRIVWVVVKKPFELLHQLPDWAIMTIKIVFVLLVALLFYHLYKNKTRHLEVYHS